MLPCNPIVYTPHSRYYIIGDASEYKDVRDGGWVVNRYEFIQEQRD